MTILEALETVEAGVYHPYVHMISLWLYSPDYGLSASPCLNRMELIEEGEDSLDGVDLTSFRKELAKDMRDCVRDEAETKEQKEAYKFIAKFIKP
jgi:hypothetical protein